MSIALLHEAGLWSPVTRSMDADGRRPPGRRRLLDVKGPLRQGWFVVSSCALLVGAAQHSIAQTITSNQTGNHSGYFYSYWKDTGSASMNLGSGGNYSVNWNLGSGNFV